MTAQTRKFPVEQILTVLIWIAFLSFVIGSFITFITLLTASTVGGDIGNPKSREGTWAFCLLVGLAVWAILWAVVRNLTPASGWIRWLNKKSNKAAGGILGLMWMAVFPPSYYWFVDSKFPAELGTEPGHVRIMNTGELLLPGMVIPTDRFARTSKIVPVNKRRTGTVSFDGLGHNGFSTRVTATVEYEIRTSASLRQILIQHYSDIPYVKVETLFTSGSDYSFLDAEVGTVLRPTIDRMLIELVAQPTNGAPSELTIRSRAAAEGASLELPEWLVSLRVSNITVEGWEKQ